MSNYMGKSSFSRWHEFAMVGLSVLNLLFMHNYFRFSGYFETWPYAYSSIVNLCGVCFDILILLLFFSVLVNRNLKYSLFLCFVVTWLWALSNVIYGRFFMQYLTLSAIQQAGSLSDGLVVRSVLSNIKWFDVYFVLSMLLFIILYVKMPIVKLSGKCLLRLFIMSLFPLLMMFFIYTAYHFSHSTMRNNIELYKQLLKNYFLEPQKTMNSFPNEIRYHNGSLRILYYEVCDIINGLELTKEDVVFIENESKLLKQRVSTEHCRPEINNVVFILLESFMSFVTEMKIDGKVITPFLDSLKHDASVYYNGHVKTNVTIGESGDGQFIYMTGILPLRSKQTVGIAKSNLLPSLPRILKKYSGVKKSEIILPTSTQMWQQEAMNRVYGIDRAYQNIDIVNDKNQPLTDVQVFEIAKKTILTDRQHLFSIILNVETHQPYRKPVENGFVLHDESLPVSFRNYLIACHQVDCLIQDYFSHLKKYGMYDKSLIVIVSDHHAHLDAMGMSGKLPDDIPLYIINGNVDNRKAWHGSCNQLDVFTTILDVLNVDCEWKGLGHTLLLPNYVNSVTPKIWDVSELIIEGDYFRFFSQEELDNVLGLQ